jgi:uncharacterized membrane protein YfcA
MFVFQISLILVGILAGAIASICGFGIGSFMTPLLALKTSTGIAVAGVSIVHFLGTAFRFWKWKEYINRQILLTFGVMSAIGGLMGALFHNFFQNIVLTEIFGSLLLFAGFSGMTGLSNSWRLNGPVAWVAGALSGLFGGLVGNQGGIRSAAMFGFDLQGKEFVATATGIALAVDCARMPVYFVMQWKDIVNIWPLIILGSVGVLVGTELGVILLGRIPEKLFKQIVSAMVFIIGIYVLRCH